MKINSKFTVIARCMVSPVGGDEESSWKEDVSLEFNEELAETFLSRFAPEGFKLNDYKLLFKSNDCKKIEAITLFKDGNIYIITNPNQVITLVMQGYDQLRFLSKVSDIISFDFDAFMDIKESKEEVEDEFGEE